MRIQFFRAITVLVCVGAMSSFIQPAASFKMPYQQAGYSKRAASALLLDRFSFGGKPGELDEVVKLGPEKWFLQQLEGQIQEDDFFTQKLHEIEEWKLSNEQIAQSYLTGTQILRLAIQKGWAKPSDSIQINNSNYRQELREFMLKEGLKPIGQIQQPLIQHKMIRAIYSKNQLQEVLTDFWFNHFNVAITKGQSQPYVMTYERDAIRPHTTGKFLDLLEATAHHPAMLEYLDNARSGSNNNRVSNFRNRPGVQQRVQQMQRQNMTREDSAMMQVLQQNGLAGNQGLNENYARELMELHTLGVDGGYTQKDVTEVARALTGWSILPLQNKNNLERVRERAAQAKNRNGVQPLIIEGDFMFRGDRHDEGEKMILGKTFPAGRGYEEGKEVLAMLAAHASTAQFISKKLAIRFVSDTPPPALVNAMAKEFAASEGHIASVLKTMVAHPLFWKSAGRQKIKSPFELIISAVRTTDAKVRQPQALAQWCTRMGQRLYAYQAPTGYPDRASYWINSGSVLNRMNFGLALASGKVQGVQIDLAKIHQNREPESVTEALEVFSKQILPERPLESHLQRLEAMVQDRNVATAIEKATDQMDKSAIIDHSTSAAVTRKDMLAHVLGIIIGSPEFQRK